MTMSGSRNSGSSVTGDGYKIIGLVERSVWFRGDVFPFVIWYVCCSGSGEHVELWLLLGLVCHVLLFIVQQWNVMVRVHVGYSTTKTIQQATHALVIPPHTQQQSSDIVPLIASSDGDDGDDMIVCNYQDIIFRCGKEQHLLTSLWKNNPSIPTSASALAAAAAEEEEYVFHRLPFPVCYPLEFYAGYENGLSTVSQMELSKSVYGKNETPVQLPSMIRLVQEQCLAPLFLFQLVCVGLWSLDEYWYYALFTLFTLGLFECTVAYQRLRNLQQLQHSAEGNHQYNQWIWVYRQNNWTMTTSSQLLVGDILSLSSRDDTSNTTTTTTTSSHEGGCHVPADIVLLHGEAVVNEAMLTGESIPRSKHPISTLTHHDNDPTTTTSTSTSSNLLDMEDTAHQRSILFGGTTLVNHTPSSSSSSKMKMAPNKGCIGMVVRTGFETQQGSLLRTMIHTSKNNGSKNNNNNNVDTLYFIALLLACAVAASWFLLDSEWTNAHRNRFKLVLHVVIIITSVVPPELPMELSLAVTSSLADLIRHHQITCTEPYRIPLAGQVNTCAFDKTGTLTSDEMIVSGLRILSNTTTTTTTTTIRDDLLSIPDMDDNDEDDELSMETSIPDHVMRVLVGCQSLTVLPMNQQQHSNTNKTDYYQKQILGDPLEKAILASCQWKLHTHPQQQQGTTIVYPPIHWKKTYNAISILQQFPFSSKLKRMSVVVQDIIPSTSEKKQQDDNNLYVLTKGAPETILQYLKHVPTNYTQVYQHHQRMGQRVLALAYKPLLLRKDQNKKKYVRSQMECDLLFAGFVIIHCPLKPNSRRIINSLQKSGHSTLMITGDAILTAAQVAKQVKILSTKRKTYELIQQQQPSENHPIQFAFVPLVDNDHDKQQQQQQQEDNDQDKVIAYTPSNLKVIQDMIQQKQIQICVTGDVLTQIAFQKTVLSSSSSTKDEAFNKKDDPKAILLDPMAQSELIKIVPLISVFARHAPRQKEAVIAALNGAGRVTLMCGDGTNDVGALKMAHVGISIISVPDIEAKQRDLFNKTSKMRKKNKHKKTSKQQQQQSKQSLMEALAAMQEAEEELAQVSLGDASVASPFTSRTMSIQCTKDILQRGRCTLVTMLQIYKVLGVNCLVNAMVLTSLHLVGAKQGDRQMTAVGCVVAFLFFFVTKGQPLEELSPKRPPSTVMCVEALGSITIQFLIHFFCIQIIGTMASLLVDPYEPSYNVPDGPFNPNVLNTATFLMTVLATVNTFVVNYRGRPFMQNLSENKVLLRTLQASYAILILCALEVFPPINVLLQLAPLPPDVESTKYYLSLVSEHEQDVLQNLNPIYQFFVSNVLETFGFKITICLFMMIDFVGVYVSQQAITYLFDS